MTSLPSQFQPLGHRTYPARRLGARMAQDVPSTLYEAPANRSARIDTIFITSVHSGSEALRIHHVRPGESPSMSNALYYDLSVAAKSTTVVDATIYMTPGDKIVIQTSASDHVCVTLYGEET